MTRIEFSPAAARMLRALAPPGRRAIAERIGHLETGGLPFAASDAGAKIGSVAVPAGDYTLICIPYDEDRAILVAAIEPAHESAATTLARVAAHPFRRAHRRITNADAEQYAAAWPRAAGPWSLRFPVRGTMLMDTWTEIRRAFRSVFREPMVAGLAIAALALGIGLPAAMFGLLNAAVLRGLPVDEPRAVLHLERHPLGRESGEGWGVPVRDYLEWKEQQRSFEDLAAYYHDNIAFRAGSQTDRYDALRMTVNTFSLVRAEPVLGRTFNAQDEAPGTPPVILSYAVWRDRFERDPGILGQNVFVDGVAHTIIGVMPERFRFPLDQDIWLPFVVPTDAAIRTDLPLLDVVGRLRDGASRDEARAEFALIAARLAQQYPETNREWGIFVKPFTERYLGAIATQTMYVFVGAVLLVLLIACTNVANLLLVRAVHRVRDLAVRVALGARRARILASLFLESAVLALLGGIGGVAIAAAAIGLLNTLIGDRLPYWAENRIDPPVLAFTATITLLAAFIAGILPAFKATSTDVTATLKDESRGSTGIRMGRIMQSLVVVQIALSLALLVTTGLLVRGIANVRTVGVEFAPERILTARITMPDEYDTAARVRFYQQLEASLAADPDISSVTIASETPIMRSPVTRIALEGTDYADDDDLPRARVAYASSAFFTTFSTRPTRGRVFETSDAEGTLPVAVVNEKFAARFFAGENPIGRRFRVGGSDAERPWRTIVGVVPDLWMAALDASGDRNPAGFYLPITQATPRDVVVALAARGEPASLTPRVRDAVFDLDPDIPIHEVRSMPTVIEDNSWFYGMGAAIMGTTGIGAFLLAVIGLYGVVAFSVGRRTREIGIRMAMGADSASIIQLVLRRGTIELAIGLVIGLVLAYIIAQGVSSLMFNVSPGDPIVFASVSVLLVAVALAATSIPALRAARTDPLVALRAE